MTNDCVTTNGTGTDVTVKQIATGYEIRGMVSLITSTDSATQGAGTILNQVAMTYNAFGQLAEEQQDHGGAVSGSSPNVQYAYDSGASNSNEIRLNLLTYPNGRLITYGYGTSGGMSDYLNRVDAIQDTTSGTTTLANYTYLGVGIVVRITYPQPSVWLDLWGGTSGTFNGIDLFDRIIDQRWQNGVTGTPTDIDRYQYGYDLDSNRIYKANVVGTPIVTGGLDEYYTYDHLNRLTEMKRGTLNSGKTGITGTPSREMDYTLDPTGNWSAYLTKTAGTTDLNQTRTANTVNEITAIGGTPAWATPPAYDAAGNMTAMPQVSNPANSFTAVYDAWNRMVSISASGTTVGKYQYDGRNFRVVKLTYTGGILSETRHFYYTSNWQDIEQRVGTSTSMDQQHVWGVRYIDELVCRDDATPLRLYATQDANVNLTAIADTSGTAQERYLFDPYGYRTIMNAAWSVIATSAYAWIVGHQGLMDDVESGLIYNRTRFLHAAIGAFLERDQSGYVQGINLYQYVGGDPTDLVDPMGEKGSRPAPPRPSHPIVLPHVCGTVTCNCPCKPITVNVIGNSVVAGALFFGRPGCVTLPDGIHCSMTCAEIKSGLAASNSGIIPLPPGGNPPILDHECCHACKLAGPPILNLIDWAGSAIADDCSIHPIPSHPNF